MKKFLLVLAAVLGAAHATFADEAFVIDGGAPAYEEIHAVYHGQPVTLLQITTYYHEMDLKPNHDQIIGLEEFIYVEKSGQAFEPDMCERWVTRVADDESDWTEDAKTFPYLEIAIAAGAKTMTINELPVYHAKDVLCWEALDFGPPRY